jgi:hypothetical protein
MNIRKALEEEHSKRVTSSIVRYVGADKGRFKSLMDLFLKSEYRITQRAAWPLSNIARENPLLIGSYLSRLIDLLGKPGHHAAVSRNILRILQDYKVPENHAAKLFDICLALMRNETSPVAVRAFAISTAANIASRYEGLDQEIRPILEELIKYPQTAAIRQRIKKALKSLRTSN